jgi:hypothetical protein
LWDFTPEQLEELKIQARVELVRRYARAKDVLNWGAVLFPEKFTLPFCSELHEYLVSIRNEPFTNTEAPRNHSKTTIQCFLVKIFQALEEPQLYKHYLSVQKTEGKALAVNTAIKLEFELNDLLALCYGTMKGRGRWTDQQFVLRNGVIFSAIGAGQSVRGINYMNIRPDYIDVDDLYDEEDINNVESTLKKNAWFWSSLFSCRAKSKNSAIHVQGTAINNEDLLNQLKGKERWVSKTFRAVKDWQKKIVLWKELNSFEDLMNDRKDMGTTIFMRELQNERRSDADSIVKESWLQYYNPEELKLDEKDKEGNPIGLQIEEVLLGCDPSIGKEKKTKSTSDFTGIALVLKCYYPDSEGSVYFIQDIWNQRLSLYKRIRLLSSIFKSQPDDCPITRAPIEGISGFQDFVSEVSRSTDIPVSLVDHVKDKISNLESKSHYFENGKVFINQDINPELRDILVHQLTTNYPKHDDVRDAVLLCIDGRSGADIVLV